MDKRTVKLIKGFGHAINESVRGMLLLLPVPLHRRQVVEIQVPSKARETPRNPILSPASTAEPHPAKTRTNVPTNSARYLDIVMVLLTDSNVTDIIC